MTSHRLPRLGAALVLTAGLVAVPLSASAHVTVNPDEAEPGGGAQLSFAVPNESAEAATTKVSVALPRDTPFLHVSFQPVPGWKGTVTRARLDEPVKVGETTVTEAPVAVTWTAVQGTRLEQGQFQNFTVSVYPVPERGQLVLPATQTYSDGRVVKWDDPTEEGQEEPEHPAPVVTIGKGSATDTSALALDTSGSTEAAHTAAMTHGTDGIGVLGLVVGAAGLAVGVIALIVAVAVGVRRQRSAA